MSEKKQKGVAELLGEAIDFRTTALWQQIEVLPRTTFNNTEDSLKAVEAVGLEAGQIRLLRQAVMYPAPKFAKGDQ